jgi:iron complex outermembrane receptor protein
VRARHLLGAALLPATLVAAAAHAQVPVPRDSAAVEIESLTVTVTRTPEPRSRVPQAVSIIDRKEIARGKATLGVDETLADLPGVYVANRYNYSLDQRLSIRGFGSRASFGTRGVKVILDGVPQTLPDGQSQLTNLELASIGRIEVLRGASSALYGNASGGVISFTSLPTAPDPLGAALRFEGGSYGLRKGVARLYGRSGMVSGSVSFSRTAQEGFRQHSTFEGGNISGALDWFAGGSTRVTFRAGVADQPLADNPGALNAAELAANRDSAPANNIDRDATKDVVQQQYSVAVTHYAASGAEYQATAFYFGRDLDNPLATNIWNLIDRNAAGLRLQGSWPLGAGTHAPRLVAGADLQSMRDDRTNTTPVPAVGPVTDTLLRQREFVTEVGPFVQVAWPASDRWLLSGGVRYDAVKFTVDDALLGDGDNSGAQTMSAFSGGGGVSYRVSNAFIPYLNLSTGFETPTTTELAIAESGGQGFNDSIGPQRARSFEIGGRGTVGHALEWSVALFTIGIRDAVVPYSEVAGRTYFRNAGEARNKGYELGVAWRPTRLLALQAAWTHSNYRYTDYVVVTNDGADTATFTGTRLPGVPVDYLRLGLRASLPARLWLDVDHTLSSEMYADDANTISVDGWGAGVSNLRFGWDGTLGAARLAPFAAVYNLWDRTYTGSVTVNGFGGRVFEPSPRRNFYAGVELGWRRTGG